MLWRPDVYQNTMSDMDGSIGESLLRKFMLPFLFCKKFIGTWFAYMFSFLVASFAWNYQNIATYTYSLIKYLQIFCCWEELCSTAHLSGRKQKSFSQVKEVQKCLPGEIISRKKRVRLLLTCSSGILIQCLYVWQLYSLKVPMAGWWNFIIIHQK